MRQTAWFVFLCPIISLAQPQLPSRGTAERVVLFRWEEMTPRTLTEAAGPRLGRQIHAPLATKDRWELTDTDALSPTFARLLAPQAPPPGPRSIAPATPRLVTGFRGALDDLTTIPPDTTGAVGPIHVMTTLNNNFQVQRRDGTVLRVVAAEQFFERLGPFQGGVFDPRVVFDPVSSRWIVLALADARLATSAMCIAVSDTGDPSGTWTQARIEADVANSLWFDYPNLALIGERLFVSANIFRRDSFQRSEIYLFNLADLLGGRFPFRRFTDTRGTPVAPSSVTNLTRIPVLTQGGNVNGQAVLRVGEISGVAGAEVYDNAIRVVPAGDAYLFTPPLADFAPQLGTTARISTNDARLQNCAAGTTTFFCTHQIFLPAGDPQSNPQRVAVQYYEVSFADYTLVQRGRVEDPNNVIQYAFPSVAVNRNNDVLLAYSRFAPDQYATASYSLRLATDPLGELQPDTLLKRGEAPYQRGSGENRWGDYSATVVDPVDGVSFWTVQTYAASTSSGSGNRWGTWWGRIEPRSAACNFTVSPATLPVGPGTTTVTATVTAAPGCRWMAAADAGWITLTSSGLTSSGNGEGNGTVTATVTTNPAISPRSSTLTIAGQFVTVQQAGNPTPPVTQLSVSSLSIPATAAVGERFSASVRVTNISTLASGAFRVSFFLSRTSPVTASDTRLGGCVIADGLEPQEGVTCGGMLATAVSLSPGAYFIAAIADDRRETSMTDRGQATRIAEPTVFAPSPLAPAFTAASVAHGATAQSGALSPGQVVVIYGNRLGPAALRGLQLDASGQVATELDRTRVLFNGIPAPMLYTSAGQLSCVVPFGLTPGTAAVQVEYQTRRSAEVTMPVQAVTPGYFTLDFSGRGPGAFVNNANGQVNGAGNAAPRGSIVLLYATGGGRLNPQVADGSVIGAPLPALLATPVEVTIGGLPAAVTYAGPAGGIVAGVLQLNVVVPAGVTPGPAVPITLRMGGVAAPAGVTIAVR